MWNRLHAVEEALFVIKPSADVASDGLNDEMRLKDSNINNSTDYVGRLRLAIETEIAEPMLRRRAMTPSIRAPRIVRNSV
jgi:hypothetical protein